MEVIDARYAEDRARNENVRDEKITLAPFAVAVVKFD
jgi:hypothetical protein